MAGHQDVSGALRNLGQFASFLATVGEGLFHEDMLSAHQGALRQFIMSTDVGCDQHRIDWCVQELVEIAKALHARVLTSSFVDSFRIKIATCNKPTLFVIGEHSCKVWTPITQSH